MANVSQITKKLFFSQRRSNKLTEEEEKKEELQLSGMIMARPRQPGQWIRSGILLFIDSDPVLLLFYVCQGLAHTPEIFDSADECSLALVPLALFLTNDNAAGSILIKKIQQKK